MSQAHIELMESIYSHGYNQIKFEDHFILKLIVNYRFEEIFHVSLILKYKDKMNLGD